MSLGTDHNEEKKLAAWSRRLTYPVFGALDRNFQQLLSGEFIDRINPDSYRIPKNAVALLLCSDERLNGLNLGRSDFVHRSLAMPYFLCYKCK